jgi:aromatic-L-amino-acid decarboxylase
MDHRINDTIVQEESLDPTNWENLRQLGHRMVDDMFDYLQEVRERPVWEKLSVDAVKNLDLPLPLAPQTAASVYEDFLLHVLPFNNNNIHPRFWSWVQGCGTPSGMLSDMLSSGMNANVAIGDHAPMYVERQVIQWSKKLFGFPESSSGILTSGGSIANITALIVARNHFNTKIKSGGIRAVPGQLIVYGSSETHNCMVKAAGVIGLGTEHFRKIPVDGKYRIRTDVLLQTIINDKQAGLFPFCIVGNAGTVNTGAIDDLRELAAIARNEGIWFHVDGAFGAVPALLPEFADLLIGLQEADSLAFDYHKWFYVNYEVGCVLIKNAEAHRGAFTTPANYLLHHERGLSGGPESFSNYGMELSRGFKALKVWMSLKEHGVNKYIRMIRRNIEQAKYLGLQISKNRDLELLADVSLNIVCYRYNPRHLNGVDLNELNKEILMRLQEAGIAAPSYTLLNGKYALRVAICNHRSRTEDFDLLVNHTVRIGNNLVQSLTKKE